MNMLEAHDIILLRQRLGMTAKEFGEKLGVTANTVFRWESGERFASRRHQVMMHDLAKKQLQVA